MIVNHTTRKGEKMFNRRQVVFSFLAGGQGGETFSELPPHGPAVKPARAPVNPASACRIERHANVYTIVMPSHDGFRKETNTMMKTMLVAVTMATLITGHAANAQSITLDKSSKMGRQLICRQEWTKIKEDPKQIAVTQYGSQYFVKQCKLKLEAAR